MGQMGNISARLEALRTVIPDCFVRKPSRHHHDRWKASLFHQFSLYTKELVLKSVLKDDLYNHSMTSSTAINNTGGETQIICTPAPEILGWTRKTIFLVYNVRSVFHLMADVHNLGSFDIFPCLSIWGQATITTLSSQEKACAKGLQEMAKVKTQSRRQQSKIKEWNNIFLLSSDECCVVVSVSCETETNGRSGPGCFRVGACLKVCFNLWNVLSTGSFDLM